MSNHNNEPSVQQEIDLADIFSLIGRFFKGIVYFFFKILDFMIKRWWIFLLLIIVGASLGYFTKSEPSYKANLLIKTNFKSQSYVYTAIQQFSDNLAEGDTDFITSLGKNPETYSIVEVLDIIAYIGENDRVLGEMTREFKLEDDKELFATDRFLSTYKFHKLELGLSSDKQLEDIQSLLSFINDNEYARGLKAQGIKSHKEFLESQEKSIEQIDKLIESNNVENGFTNSTAGEGFYFNNRSYDIAGLFDIKTILTKSLEEYKTDKVSYTDVAVIVSDIQASRESSILDNMIVIYPIIFVSLFLILAGIINAFIAYKKEIAST